MCQIELLSIDPSNARSVITIAGEREIRFGNRLK